jgi:hypothetical protein
VRDSRLDWYLTLALLVLGFAIGSIYIRTFLRAGGVNDFGQPEFAAAVAQACGKGFVDPGYDATPGLGPFLTRKVDTFSCGEFPATLPPQRPNLTQGLYRYLMSTVALVWRVRGVSWWALWPLFGLVYGCTLATAFGLFRLGMGRAVAFAMSIMLAVSAIHVGYIPYLRDYAKAPFILGLMLLMARLAMGPLQPRRVLAWAAAFGALLGIGFGFRNDLLISVPPFAAVVLLCLPGRAWAQLRLKLAALALAALTFTIVAWPILTAYREGSNTGHVALLGLMTPFDKPLGVEGSLYDWGHTYLDGFASVTVKSYSARVHGRFVEYLSPEYDRAMVEYILQIVRQWPADIVTRAYGSVLKTLDMPFSVGVYTNPTPWGIASGPVNQVYLWQQGVLRVFLGRGALVASLALLIIGGQSVFAAMTLLLFLLYYAGYPAIQFHIRHFFHLEFIGWWAIGFVLQRLWQVASAFGRRWAAGAPVVDRPQWTAAFARAAAFAAAASVLTVGSLATLRAYQAPHVREMLKTYEAGSLVALQTAAEPRGDRTLLTVPALWAGRDAREPVSTRYVVAQFAPACPAAVLPVTFRYRTEGDASDFSRALSLSLISPGAPTRVWFPAYYNGEWSHFVGVEVPLGYERCLESIGYVADLTRYPLLIGLTLPPDWEHATLFQTLTALESANPGTGDRHAIHTIPADTFVTRTAFEGRLVNPAALDYGSEIARRADDGGGWIISGRPPFPTSPLVSYAPHRVGSTAVFVAEGELRDGAVNIGLTRAGHWARNLEIRNRGPFLIAIAPPEAGEYGVLVTSQLSDRWPANRVGHRLSRLVWWIPGVVYHDDLVIRRMGWLDASQP